MNKHICGDCQNMMKCIRMKLQNHVNKVDSSVIEKVLDKYKEITDYAIETYTTQTNRRFEHQRELKFIKVYECEGFVEDRRVEKEKDISSVRSKRCFLNKLRER